MAVLNNSNAISTAGGYNLNNSLRFRASASAYLSRTPASAGNQQKFTWSGWVKRGTVSSGYPVLFMGGNTTTDTTLSINFNPADNLRVSGYSTNFLITTAVYRDPSAWYHIVVAVDTTQATAANRIILYVNGSQVTATSYTAPTLNTNFLVNTTVAHDIGYQSAVWGFNYFDGYMTEVNFVDGQQLTASSFGETDTTTGSWKPKAYTGTYGTNGFYLPFTDNSALTTTTNVGLGKDFSGNANYWVTNNISITAGATYDSMKDVPTLTSATVANYAVGNVILNNPNSGTWSNANLLWTKSTASHAGGRGTFGISSGKWYWEYVSVSGSNNSLGIATASEALGLLGGDAYGWGYYNSGVKYNNGSGVAYGATFTNNDIIGIAFDADAGTLTFYKNNTSQGTAYTGLTLGPYFPALSCYSGSANVNFGQRPFSYTPPTGYVALNTYNLPDSTIKKGSSYMDATTYTGNLTGQSITNAAAFKPDLVWIKSRSAATDNKLTDFVRGTTKALISNTAGAETTDVTGLTAFNSNGFTLGASTTYNNTGVTYVAWQWAGTGTTVSNTSGSITSTVDANTTAGFSIVTYTGTGANATVGHGLGVAPKMVIGKSRSVAQDWTCWHTSFTGLEFIYLNSTGAKSSLAAVWNSTSPSSTVVSLGTNSNLNTNAATNVLYCWAEIAGFSKFGSYTGNGSADGTFVYTGFRPKFVIIKYSSGAGNWIIEDSVRDTYNPEALYLLSDAANVEASINPTMDFTANGFKIRTANGNINTSTGTYIYMAFAENPFKNANAR
jgi:hypothetical protein